MATPNERLRRLRTEKPSLADPARPMSRAELAELVNLHLWRTTGRRAALDADAISRYERGIVSWPSKSYRAAFRGVLDVTTDAELGFYPSPRGPKARPDTVDDDIMGWLQRASSVDQTTVAAMAARTEEIRSGDRGQSSVATSQALKEHLDDLWSLRAYSLEPSIREVLASVYSDTASLAGWVYLDSGNIKESWRLHEAAKDAGRESSARADLAHATAQQAYVLVDTDQPQYALRIAEHAITVGATALSGPVRSWLHGVAGEVAAIVGETIASMDHFDRAVTLLSGDTRDPDAPYIMLDEYSLARWRGAALARLGDEEAIADLHYALSGMDPNHLRAGAQLNVDLAHSLVAAGHKSEAVQALDTARGLAKRAGSARQNRRIKNLQSRLGVQAG